MRLPAFLFLSLLLLTMGSCKKKPSAGLGGQATLRIRTIHHGASIDSARVYVKFNSSEAVSLSEYDLSADVISDTAGNAFATFEGLKKGDYYLYAEGWDPAIINQVKGGIPYTISEENTQTVMLPVTEVH